MSYDLLIRTRRGGAASCALLTIVLVLSSATSGSALDTLRAGITYCDVGFWNIANSRTVSRRAEIDSTGRVHFVWAYWNGTGGSSGVSYNSYFDGALSNGSTGCGVGASAVYKQARVGVTVDGTLPFVIRSTGHSVLYEQLAGPCAWAQDYLVTYTGSGSPQYTIQHASVGPVHHLLCAGSDVLKYWRNPLTETARIVEVTETYWIVQPDFVITNSRHSDRVAIVYLKNGRCVYYESFDAGVTWGQGSGFGLAHDLGVTTAGAAVTAVYDEIDSLHIVYEEPSGGSPTGVRYRHWSTLGGLTLITEASWDHGGTAIEHKNMNHPQLAVGTADSNYNYLYLFWDQLVSCPKNTLHK